MGSDFDAEVERLARTLRANRVVQSESEAYRMANEMLATNKKVHEDFKKRDSELYSGTVKNEESEKARIIMEKLTENLAKGRENVRIDVGELDLDKPLKDMFDDEQPSMAVAEEDDAVFMPVPDASAPEPGTTSFEEPKNPASTGNDDGNDDFFGGDGADPEEESPGEPAEEDEFSVREI
jgi:hypothetical protein